MNMQHLGSDLDDFLQDEGILEDCQAVAIKRVLSYQLQEFMTQNHITKTEMATRLKTSRMGLNRLLSVDNTSITLDSMIKAANVVGKKISIELTA
jgi:predicted XRE-type DNA-binding protein